MIGAHFLGEVNFEIAAAYIGKMQIELALLGISFGGGLNDGPNDINGKPGLGRMQQVQVSEVRDLDPALTFAPHGNEKRIDDGAEPGRHHKLRGFNQSLDVFRHGRDARVRFCVDAHRCASGFGKPDDRINHSMIEQGIGQNEHLIAGPNGKHPLKILQGLKKVFSFSGGGSRCYGHAAINAVIHVGALIDGGA